MTFHFFDPDAEYAVTERRLPHWEQPGVVVFVTWRTHDSLPRKVLESWMRERDEALRRCGINPLSDWRPAVDQLSPQRRDQVLDTIHEGWEARLDECHGACVLRRPELSAIVANSLRHFDGERYFLSDFVVMPNHVHLLAAFLEEGAMLPQCESWKRFTSTGINRVLGRTGRFWQVDGFDHLVRSPEQFAFYRRYVADNPRRAHLALGEFVLCRPHSPCAHNRFTDVSRPDPIQPIPPPARRQ